MIIEFNEYLNEYYGGIPSKYVINDNSFIEKISKISKQNIKETMLYKWMKAKSLTELDFIRIVNVIYDLDIDFNQSILNSNDTIIIKLLEFFKTFYDENLSFWDFKKSLLKNIK